nr:MAG TPA: hypothetical protein [Caudoviricetes sp.]
MLSKRKALKRILNVCINYRVLFLSTQKMRLVVFVKRVLRQLVYQLVYCILYETKGFTRITL